jgi:FkbM family methyltransferase
VDEKRNQSNKPVDWRFTTNDARIKLKHLYPKLQIDRLLVQDHISQLLRNRSNYTEEVRNCTQDYPYVVFYGCGAIFSSIVDTWLEYVERSIDFCCDSDSAKWGKLFCGVKCLSPDELFEIRDSCTIFVTVGNFPPVFDFLTSSGFPSVNLIYKYDLVASAYLDSQGLEQVAQQLRSARDLFTDERSLKVFDTILERALGDRSNITLMPSICDDNQYFDPAVVELAEDECYVDIGAYDGDTIRHFMKITNNRFERIDAFELDHFNYRKLVESVKASGHENFIRAFNLGVWDHECDLNFSTGKSQSRVGTGDQVAHAVALDRILSDQRITFIKMDIEGAEPNALKGAERVIRANQPKLAICVYHHISHLWEIPLYIHGLLPDHRLYLRHYTNLEYETVCYAIPSK